MPERLYDDDEVAAIFARATEAAAPAPRALPPGAGLSLAELQEIGREVGIAPEQVALAARSLDQPAPPRPPTFLGLGIGVGHAVELGYRMTEEQWERLVLDLRETFEATGRVRSDGAFRQWTNGNLQVLVEPSGEGHRVRFRTMKGSARSLMTGGIALIGVAAFILVVGVLTGSAELAEALSDAAMTALMGAGMIGFAAATLPSWAKLRKSQMEEIGARLLRP